MTAAPTCRRRAVCGGSRWRGSLEPRRTSTSPRRRSQQTAATHVRPDPPQSRALGAVRSGLTTRAVCVAANHVFYATQEVDWRWGSNALFAGLQGIAYSRDRGRIWQFANKPFPAPLGNLNWVIRGQGGFYADGYVYAIATEREFNADTLIIGRARPDVADMTDPSRWQWLSGWTDRDGLNWPTHPDRHDALARVLELV